MKIQQEFRATFTAGAIGAWLRGRGEGRPGRAVIAEARQETEAMMHDIWPDVLTLIVGTAACAVMSTLNELARRNLIRLTPAQIAEIMETVPAFVTNSGEINPREDAQ
jgi:hypothetical protein